MGVDKAEVAISGRTLLERVASALGAVAGLPESDQGRVTLKLDDLFRNRKESDHDVRGTKGVGNIRDPLAFMKATVAAKKVLADVEDEPVCVLVSEADHPFWEWWWPHGHIIGWEHTFVHELHHLLTAIRGHAEVDVTGCLLACDRSNVVVVSPDTGGVGRARAP